MLIPAESTTERAEYTEKIRSDELTQFNFRRHQDELVLTFRRSRQCDRLHFPARVLEGSAKWGLAAHVADQAGRRGVEAGGHGDASALFLAENRFQRQVLADYPLGLRLNV